MTTNVQKTTNIFQDTRIFASSLYWHDCDPFISVVGFNRGEVQARLDEIAVEEMDREKEEDLDGDTYLCGGEVLEYSVSDFISPSDTEHLRELAEDGITVL